MKLDDMFLLHTSGIILKSNVLEYLFLVDVFVPDEDVSLVKSKLQEFCNNNVQVAYKMGVFPLSICASKEEYKADTWVMPRKDGYYYTPLTKLKDY